MKELLSSIFMILLVWVFVVGLGVMIGSFGGSIYLTFKLIARLML